MIPIEVYLNVEERKLQNLMYIKKSIGYLIINNNIDNVNNSNNNKRSSGRPQ